MDQIEWTPGIGDPTFLGWFTVFAYVLAGWLCLRAFMAEKAGPPRPYLVSIGALLRVVRKHWPNVPVPATRASLWLLLAFALFSLALNKQLDLQSLVTDLGRVLARNQGWYEGRRVVQKAFVLGLLGLGATLVLVVFYVARGAMKGLRLSLLGLVVLLTFIVIRAASFHHMDRLIGRTLLGVRMNGILELTGIFLVGLGALLRIRVLRRGR